MHRNHGDLPSDDELEDHADHLLHVGRADAEPEVIIEALSRGLTPASISRALGVPRQAIRVVAIERRAEISAARLERLERLAHDAEAGALDAIATLRDTLNSGDSSHADRLGAARTLIDAATKLGEAARLNREIAVLEQRLASLDAIELAPSIGAGG